MSRNFHMYAILALLLSPVSAAPVTPPSEEPASFTWPRNPTLGGWWNQAPTVRLCTESGVRESRVRRALGVWERMGYQFGPVVVDDGSLICRHGGITGEIIIILPNHGAPIGKNIALARTMKDTDTGEILRAQIFITPHGGEKLLVLEHEIGHALGWRHHMERYHLMNPSWPQIGHNSKGLTWAKYEEEMERIRAPGRD